MRETQPILASRVGQLRLHLSQPFGAVSESHGWFGREEMAYCAYGAMRTGGRHDPTVPDPTCSCGFYSVTRDAYYLGPLAANQVRLDVELAGRVIIHERGYRAEWQRVLGVRVPPCFACGGKRSDVKRTPVNNRVYFSCSCPHPARVLFTELVAGYEYGQHQLAVPYPLSLVRSLTGVDVTLEGTG